METIIENCKAIAKFIEIEFKDRNVYLGGHKFYNMNFWTTKQAEKTFYNEAKYHLSYDWLIPVVDKIELIDFTIVTINKFGVRIVTTDINDKVLFSIHPKICNFDNSKIDTLYNAVTRFIEWYNLEY